MSRILLALATTILVTLAAGEPLAQMVRNPKLSQRDLTAAQSEVREAGGAASELVYATRIDAAEKGSFDSLVVVYAKPVKGGKDYFGFVSRGGKRYGLNLDGSGKALKSGDRFLRIGLKHEGGKAPLLRLMGVATIPRKPGEWQRNVDFQFNGSEFALVDQSMAQLVQ